MAPNSSGTTFSTDSMIDPMPTIFDGNGYCYIEMGKRTATLIEGQFYAEPQPEISLGEPSASNKHQFEVERLVHWSGA